MSEGGGFGFVGDSLDSFQRPTGSYGKRSDGLNDNGVGNGGVSGSLIGATFFLKTFLPGTLIIVTAADIFPTGLPGSGGHSHR